MKFASAPAALLWLSSMVNHVAGQITLAQVAQHSTGSDCWTAIGGNVYNLSAFVPSHPNNNLLVLCGVDGTTDFDNQQHSRSKLSRTSVQLLGTLVDQNGNPAPTTPPGPQAGDSSDDSGDGNSSDNSFFSKICFSGEVTLQLENGVSRTMRDLQVGDRVQVGPGQKYETVYAFAKRDATIPAEYLQVQWKANNGQRSDLELSHKHMLAVMVNGANEGWMMIPASKLKIGDVLQVMSGAAFVSSIRQVHRYGAYAPLTFSGKIVVNNVQASTYVSYQNTEYLKLGSGTQTRVTYQWLAQAFLLPIRWMGALVATLFHVDMFAWLPHFFLAIEPAILKVLGLPAPILFFVVVPLVAVLGVISLLESALLGTGSHPCILASLILAGVFVYKRWRVTVRTFKKVV